MNVDDLEDILNLYAVARGYRKAFYTNRSAVVDSLVEKLRLCKNSHLIPGDESWSSLEYLITKRPVRKSKLDDESLGQLLGYFCVGQKSWDDIFLERIGVQLYAKGVGRELNDDDFIQLYAYACVSKDINKHNIDAFVKSVENLRQGYQSILVSLGVKDIEIKSLFNVGVVLSESDDGITIDDRGVKFDMETLINWKKYGIELVDQDYVFK